MVTDVIKENTDMGAYRQYKNGVYGIRYRGYYISRVEAKNFDILENDLTPVMTGVASEEECRWNIYKLTADEKVIKSMKVLYAKSFPYLDELTTQLLFRKTDAGGKLSDKDKELWDILVMIKRRRKAGKPY